jgi:hypothetical protein
VDDDDDDGGGGGGKLLDVVKDFFDVSWLCEREFLDGGDAGDKFVVVVVVVSLVVDGGLCSNREIRLREPNKTLFDADCWALSCNFWSSDRWDSSVDVDW